MVAACYNYSSDWNKVSAGKEKGDIENLRAYLDRLEGVTSRFARPNIDFRKRCRRVTWTGLRASLP